MPDDVIDRDLGYKAAVARLVEAEGMQVRAGILSAVPKYPKSRPRKGGGGTQVAKVAAVHGMVKAFGDAFDRKQGEINHAIERAHAQIIGGATAAQALVQVGEVLRDEMRGEVERAGLVDTGRLRETVRSAVFDGAKRVAGDDHRGPKASEAV
jgi:hypothetical protein